MLAKGTSRRADPVRLIVSGLGNIGRRFLKILERKADHLCTHYGLTFKVVGAADSRGAAIDPDGLNVATIVHLKAESRSIAEYPDRGRSGVSPLELLADLGRTQVNADALCEATPVNLENGEPGLSCIRAAMNQGMNVVTANKGPLVLAYPELITLAREKGVRLLFCGTVAGGLPAINLGRRDLAGAVIHRLEALLNLTTSFILEKMSQGLTYEQALAGAQAQGCAEADPSLDVEGWDAASKLVILANSVLNVPATLDDVHVQGITGITPTDLGPHAVGLAKASGGRPHAVGYGRGAVIKLVASATRQADGGYKLTVAPIPLPADHPLAQLGGQQMGIVYHTDIYGTISAAILEEEPVPSAAAMLRDLLSIYRGAIDAEKPFRAMD